MASAADERSGLESWLGTLCCVLAARLASHSGVSRTIPSRFMLEKPG